MTASVGRDDSVRGRGWSGKPGPAAPPKARPGQGSVAPLPCLGAVGLELRGEGGGLRAAAHAELGEDVRDVVLDRLLGQEEALADLPVGQALADELQDVPLLLGQALER